MGKGHAVYAHKISENSQKYKGMYNFHFNNYVQRYNR